MDLIWVCWMTGSEPVSNSSVNLRWRQRVHLVSGMNLVDICLLFASREVIRCAGIEPWSEVIECEAFVAFAFSSLENDTILLDRTDKE